jgi:hypothetical protein
MSTKTNIQYDFLKGRQSIELIRVVEIDGHKIKVHINRDSYDNQSSSVAYAWTDAGWKPVISRPGAHGLSSGVNAHSRDWEFHEDKFAKDSEVLIEQALAVLS